MTERMPADDADPRRLLSSSRHLTRRVRDAQRGTWFPLLAFAAASFVAIPFDRLGHRTGACRSGAGYHVCSAYTVSAFVYWPIALVAVYTAVAVFYTRRAHRRGVGTHVRPFVVVGVVIVLLATGAALWAAHHPITTTDFLGLHLRTTAPLTRFLGRLATPGAAMGLALLLLCWVERSWVLLAVTAAYLAVVLVPVDFGWVIALPSRWTSLPHQVIGGSLLLLGATGFALGEHATRRREI